jgi:hypothetical protein
MERLVRKGKVKAPPDLDSKIAEPIKNLLGRLTTLEARVADSFKDVFTNQQQLKAALDSAEYNLRAHQKVLNAVVSEIAASRLGAHAGNPDIVAGFSHLDILHTGVETKIDWPKYHGYVTKDLEELQKLEDEKLKSESLQMAAEIKKDLEWFTERKVAEISKLELEPRLAAETTLKLFLARASAEVDNVLEDKDFDHGKLKKVFKLFAAERVRASEETEEEPAIPSEAPEPEDESEPEGATIFGGA